jgi:N-acetylglucosamine-6-sulfatase
MAAPREQASKKGGRRHRGKFSLVRAQLQSLKAVGAVVSNRRRSACASRCPRALVALASLVAFLLALAAPGGGIEAADAQAQRPNVIVIYTDDQDIASMRAMPLTRQAIARHGVTFSRHVTTLSHCCPSRATFLTGQYTHNHGVWGNRPPHGGWQVFDDSGALPVALRNAGYRTGYVGKYLNGYPPRDSLPGPVPPGWSDWFALVDWQVLGWRANANGNMRHFWGPRRHQTDVLKRRAVRFIRQSAGAGQPFFLTVATLAPHTEPRINWRENPRSPRRHEGRFEDLPLRVGPAFNRASPDKPFFVRNRRPRNERQLRRLAVLNQNRLRSLLSVDELVDDVVAQLRRAGQLDNTYVIFTSDNGFMLGEHRQRGKNRLYEPSIRVPFLIRGPGVPSGVRRPQLTANIDLAPTIFDVTGAEPLIEPDGISMLPAAASRGADADRQILLAKGLPSPRGDSVGIRTPRYMYAEHETPEGAIEYELYDMRDDPHQLRNLEDASDPERPGANPRLVGLREQLRTRMEQLRQCAGTSPPQSCR